MYVGCKSAYAHEGFRVDCKIVGELLCLSSVEPFANGTDVERNQERRQPVLAPLLTTFTHSVVRKKSFVKWAEDFGRYSSYDLTPCLNLIVSLVSLDTIPTSWLIGQKINRITL